MTSSSAYHSALSYVFLVDTDARCARAPSSAPAALSRDAVGRVRWRASGPPSAEYIQFVQDAHKALAVKAAGEKARKML